MMLLMESVFILPPILLKLLIWDADHGIGKTRNVWPALTSGHSITTVFVCLFLINVLLMIIQDSAQLATKVMTSTTVNASSLNPTTPSLLTLDAELGTGTIKFVSHAPMDGFSTTKKFAFLSLISAKLMLITETAQPASKDMTLKTVLVCFLTLIMPSPLT